MVPVTPDNDTDEEEWEPDRRVSWSPNPMGLSDLLAKDAHTVPDEAHKSWHVL